jgi:hypothetical protein
MSEFETCAREYCDVKVRHVDLKRLIHKLPCKSENRRRFSYSEESENPCWWDYGEGSITLDEACENCQITIPQVKERGHLGKLLPNLAKAMYAAYRAEGGEDE